MAIIEREPSPGNHEFRLILFSSSEIMSALSNDLRFSEVYYSDFDKEKIDPERQHKLDEKATREIEELQNSYENDNQLKPPFIVEAGKNKVLFNSFDDMGRLVRQKFVHRIGEIEEIVLHDFYYWENSEGQTFCLEMLSDEEKENRYTSEFLYVGYDSFDMVDVEQRRQNRSVAYSIEESKQVVRQVEKTTDYSGWSYEFERAYHSGLEECNFVLDYENFSGNFSDETMDVTTNTFRRQKNPTVIHSYVEAETPNGYRFDFQQLDFKYKDQTDLFTYLPRPDLFDSSSVAGHLNTDLRTTIYKDHKQTFKFGKMVLNQKSYAVFEINKLARHLLKESGKGNIRSSTSILAAKASSEEALLVGIDLRGRMQMERGLYRQLLPAGFNPALEELKPIHLEILSLVKKNLHIKRESIGGFVEVASDDPEKAGVLIINTPGSGEVTIEQIDIGSKLLKTLQRYSKMEAAFLDRESHPQENPSSEFIPDNLSDGSKN